MHFLFKMADNDAAMAGQETICRRNEMLLNAFHFVMSAGYFTSERWTNAQCTPTDWQSLFGVRR